MKSLSGKQILLGVTGGIAAYKAADLVRRFQDAGAQVRVVMTTAAQAFVTPLTFQALSGNPVHTDLLDSEAEAAMGHIELARWADAIVVAPATADFIARLSHGNGDDLLTTLCLASEAPMAVAPAMNRVMWADAATQANVQTLKTRGVVQFGPASGAQACGEIGEGRMLDPLDIVELTATLFSVACLAGRRVLVTAGPTREAIDPVRYLSNRSSGRMGYAVAQAAQEAGAVVTLISGPVSLTTPERVERVNVSSAADMYAQVMTHVDSNDIFIATAAVADYRPADVSDQKIKKSDSNYSIRLEPTQDILSAVADLPNAPFCVGFAAETQNVAHYAQQKLQRKKLDMIAANDVSRAELGFDSERNALHVFWQHGDKDLGQGRKTELARQLVELIAKHA